MAAQASAQADPVETEEDSGELTSVPPPGRLLEDAIGVAPGAINDGVGMAVAGSTALENRYVLDGIDITELRFGGMGQTVPLEMLDRVRVIAGAAGPDIATSTGALIEAVTKHGTNELHGGVFGAYAPSWLARGADHASAPGYPSTITATRDGSFSGDLGAELGGPIVRDRLWFYAAFDPMRRDVDFLRQVHSQIDVDRDGRPDVDPATGFPNTIVVASETRTQSMHSYPTLARLDAELSPRDHASLTALAVPTTLDSPGLIGLASTGTRTSSLATDVALHERSQLGDRWDLDGTLAWHRARTDIGAIDPSVADQPLQVREVGIDQLAGYESQAAVDACKDGGRDDRFPLIPNCPSVDYPMGGPGQLSRDLQDRWTARLAATTHVGPHAVSFGGELAQSWFETAQVYSGGYSSTTFFGSPTASFVQRWVKLEPPGSTDLRYDHLCPRADGSFVRCEYLSNLDEATTRVTGSDAAIFVRDQWQLSPELRVDAGVRYEWQRVENQIRLGDLAPRIGVSYDPDGTGQSRVFAHWGRYFESVPFDFAARDTGNALLTQVVDPSGVIAQQLSENFAHEIAPNLRSEYVDETVARAEHIIDGTVLGATFQDRRLGRAIEDISLDGANSYILANPAEGVARLYDRPQRVYDAVELTASRRFSRGFVLASYTYSRTFGDYPGSVSYSDGQIDPNNSSQYDLIELAPNRLGLLPQDHPHVFKVDAAYSAPIGPGTALVIGTRVRALSGQPELALASHFAYGPDESYLLPASAFGRTPTSEAVDLHLGVRRSLPRRTSGELYVDILNLFDQQQVFHVDDTYAPPVTSGPNAGIQNANPISGGSYSDLIWAKQLDELGDETARPIGRNPAFHKPTTYYAPTYVRLGFRLAF